MFTFLRTSKARDTSKMELSSALPSRISCCRTHEGRYRTCPFVPAASASYTMAKVRKACRPLCRLPAAGSIDLISHTIFHKHLEPSHFRKRRGDVANGGPKKCPENRIQKGGDVSLIRRGARSGISGQRRAVAQIFSANGRLLGGESG